MCTYVIHPAFGRVHRCDLRVKAMIEIGPAVSEDDVAVKFAVVIVVPAPDTLCGGGFRRGSHREVRVPAPLKISPMNY